MGKFVLAEIKKRIEEKALGLKVAAQLNLAGGMSLVMDKMFSFYKAGLIGYSGEKPSTTDKWLIQFVVIPAIDKKYNQASIDRLKEMIKKDKPSKEDVKFIKEEVIPYFNTNCKRLTGKELELIGMPTTQEFETFKEKIDSQVKKGKKVDSKLTQDVLEKMEGVKKIR